MFRFVTVKSLFILSLPIMLGQIGQMLIGAGDVYIAGLYSTNTVASIGIANGLINPLFLFGIGLMFGISPLLSIYKGKGEKDENELGSVIIYSLIMGIIISSLAYVLSFLIYLMPFEEDLRPSILLYIKHVIWSFPFAYGYQAIKEYLQAREEVFIANLLSILAVFLNIALNWFLVFGWGSFEGFGEIGLAYASILIRLLLFLSILIYVYKEIIFKFNYKFTIEVFKFSLPVAFMFFLEVLAFAFVSVVAGFFNVQSAAATNIILTMSSLVFMIPLSLSSATAVKVGRSFGAKNFKGILENAYASILITLFFMFISASVFYLFPNFLLSLFTEDISVIELGIRLIFIVAIFQIFDGLQVILSGILRGVGETSITSKCVFIGYWLMGIPFGLYLAYIQNLEIIGLWIGLALSLALLSIFLVLVFMKKMQQLRILLKA